MSWPLAIILGIVQGLTEFLPVSSSGHLAIIQNLFSGVDNLEESHLFFDVLLHLGTLVAVCIFYRKDIVEMFRAVVAIFTGNRGTERNPVDPSKSRLAIMIIISMVPLVFALIFSNAIELLGTSTRFVGVMLIITGGILYFSDKLAQGKRNEKNMTWTDSLIVGAAQLVGTIPGISRSGITITTGVCVGFSRSFAVRFSFLMSIPAIFLANIISLFRSFSTIQGQYVPMYLVGVVIAGVVGYFAIGFVKRLVDAKKFGYFSYYCWAVALVALIAPFFVK